MMPKKKLGILGDFQTSRHSINDAPTWTGAISHQENAKTSSANPGEILVKTQ